MKQFLRDLIGGNNTPQGKVFDYTILILIVVSMISFSIETLPDNSELANKVLHSIEVFCIVVFTTEYLLRIYASERPLKYIFSFYGLIDLMAILPFYFLGAVDLMAVRVFRVFKIFRALRLIQYHRALHRFRIAARIVREELVLFLIFASILVFLSATGIHYFEHEAQPKLFSSIFHSLWWAIVTLTTVGYGDVYPITVGGKIFTFFVLMIGVSIITVPAGLVATALTKAREIEEKERHQSIR